jgi:uncharacterized membrane protein YhfC
MNILVFTYAVNGLLMVALPISLAIYLTSKFILGWRLFWIGALTFIFSQILHIPFNALVAPLFNHTDFTVLPVILQNVLLSSFLGISAGVFEELSRYIMYRWWAKEARSWSNGLLAGAGHGGIEAILIGILVLYGYIQMLIARGVDISTLVTPEKVELAKMQIEAYWSAPWCLTLLGGVERLFTLPLHLACSVLVLQAFTRNKFWWVSLAILYHAVVDGVAVFLSKLAFPPLSIEGIMGIFAIISLFILYSTRQEDPKLEMIPISFPIKEFKPKPPEETIINLDETRFQ